MAAEQTILIVEDDCIMRESLEMHLGRVQNVTAVGTCAEAVSMFEKQHFDLVILDINLPDGEGLDLIGYFRQKDQSIVVVITAYPKVQTAIGALKAGAFDYINKPFDLEEFDLVINKALEDRRLRDEVSALKRQRTKASGVDRILGRHPSLTRLREEVCQVAATPDTTVLVIGESGTGKELVAEAVHAESARRGKSLVRVNCSAIPASMMEAELFGHERGAFTDAKMSRRGLIEIGNDGTVFLDEIGDLPLELQPKLLRVIESRSFRRIGGAREIHVNVRFVAATNRDLADMVRNGTFREDLYFRLKVFELRVPPLRDRISDIPVLSAHLLSILTQHLERDILGISAEAVERMMNYSWPGNVRELKNILERAVILSRDDEIVSIDLPCDLTPSIPDDCEGYCPAFPSGFDSFPVLSILEDRYIECVYKKSGHNKTRAAQILGISRVTLRERLKQMQ